MTRQPFLHSYLNVFGISFVLWTIWNWFFAGDVTLIEMALLALPLTLLVRGFADRGGRTPKAHIFLRACVAVFVIYMLLASLWNAGVGHQFWTPLEMAVSAVISVAYYGGIAYLITHFGARMLFHNDPEYQVMREDGYDPYFDNLPQILNPDSDQERGQ